MVKKAPRRTAERILETTLALFNRFGEPNVSTTLIASELRISPGNLYYHYPAKDELVNALFTRYKATLLELLVSAPEVRQLDDAWFFIHQLMERIWADRFIYRDLNDLLSRHRRLETEMKELLTHKATAFEALLSVLCHAGMLDMSAPARRTTARHMVLQTTWWLSYAYVMNPRHALEDDQGPAAMAEATRSVFALWLPHAKPKARVAIEALVGAHNTKTAH